MDTKRPASFDDSYLRQFIFSLPKTLRERLEGCIRHPELWDCLDETFRRHLEGCIRHPELWDSLDQTLRERIERYIFKALRLDCPNKICRDQEVQERNRRDAHLWMGDLISQGLVSPDAREKMCKGEGAPKRPSNPSSFNTGRIWPDHLHIDQVHAQDSEIASSPSSHRPSQIASSSGSVERQIAGDCLTLNSTMSQPSSAPHFSLQKMSDKADVKIDILEADNHRPHLMQYVGSHTNFAFARSSSGNYVSAHDLQLSSSAMAQDMPLRPHFNRYGTSNDADVRINIDNQDDNHRLCVECFQSHVASSGAASSSGVYASVHGRLLQSDTMSKDVPSGSQFNEPESSNGPDARSEMRDHGNDNAAQRMRPDFQSDIRDPGADARSEISDHDSEMSDYGDDDQIETRPEESDHGNDNPTETRFLDTNVIFAQVAGQAVVSLMASRSADSPLPQFFAVSAACGFVGSFVAISYLRRRKVAKYLTKFSAICLLFAVSTAVGVNVLGGTKWHLNIVITVALCLASVALVVLADI